jgi:hypothetical protein
VYSRPIKDQSKQAEEVVCNSGLHGLYVQSDVKKLLLSKEDIQRQQRANPQHHQDAIDQPKPAAEVLEVQVASTEASASYYVLGFEMGMADWQKYEQGARQHPIPTSCCTSPVLHLGLLHGP